MTQQAYGTQLSRNLILAAQGMLSHAMPLSVLSDFGDNKEMPKNSTDTLVFRRTLPFGASTAGSGIGGGQYIGTPQVNVNNFVLQEGATPNANTISFQDVSVTLQDFGVLFKYTSKAALMYQDNIPEEMQRICGETMSELTELVNYGVVKAGTQVMYANGSSRSSVNSAISLPILRKAARVLESNRAKRVTQRLRASIDYGTKSVQPAFLVFVHTDAVADCRNLTGFTKVEDYGSFKPVHDREFGACEDFRFISSPLFSPFAGAGSATLNSMVSIGASAVDVYPFLIVAESAWGKVALKGMNAIKPVHIPYNQVSHSNPLQRFGYVGASTYYNAVRLNEAFLLRVECGVTAL
jgi:N4-gp56 family major capsid protein